MTDPAVWFVLGGCTAVLARAGLDYWQHRRNR